MSSRFKFGSLFPDIKTLEHEVSMHEKENCINLWKQHTRTIKAEQKRNAARAELIKEDLKYSEITYWCVRGGKKHSAKITTGERPNQKTVKIDCPYFIKLRATKDGQHLEVFNMFSEHTHEVSEIDFKLYPSQRRLQKEEKEEIAQLCSLQGNRQLIREAYAEKTGKKIIMKDVHNIAHKAKSSLNHNPNAGAEDLGDWLKENYPSLDTEFVIDENNTVTGIYFQDPQMKSSFERFPEVVLVDATHKTNNIEMPLYTLMVIDGNGESEVAAAFIVHREDEASESSRSQGRPDKYNFTIDLPCEEAGDVLTVGHLATKIQELTGVPTKNQKLIFKGKSLTNETASLKELGLKSSSKIMLIGRKMNSEDENLIKKIVAIEKTVGTTEKKLSDVIYEMDGIHRGYLAKDKESESLNKLKKRILGVNEDFARQLEQLDSLSLTDSAADVKTRRKVLVSKIQTLLNRSDEIHSGLDEMIARITS